MAEEEEPDRLSQLPDELLQNILHLAPCREAVTTAVLSRRWRGLWPPAKGAVKIDIPFASAYKALAASHGPVDRLAIDVQGEDCNNYIRVVGDVLSHPASRGVEDVRIRASRPASAGDGDVWCSWRRPYWLEFSFVSVPSAALRVLHITNCCDVMKPTPPKSTFFPCLEVLRLRHCMVTLQWVQDMVVASPHLAALQLEYVCLLIRRYIYSDDDDNNSGHWHSTKSLCCPGITTLVLLNCFYESKDDVAIELDVPRVQHFKYTGEISQITLRSPLPHVRRAYLHILYWYHSGDVEKRKTFWNLLKNFSDAKVVKLKLECASLMDYVAARVIGENQSAQSIRFCVEHLEIDAPYNPERKDTGVAIGNLLRCCPTLRDLRLKLNTEDHHRRRRNWNSSPQSNAQLEFHKSINHFGHRRGRPASVPFCGDDGNFEVSDIPGLSDRWIDFSCLRFHLRRLSLQFDVDIDNPNCIGIRLVKFFVEKGMALEEMYIHDGNTKMWEHMNCKISRYSANPQPISVYQFFARMSKELSMNQFSSSKISGCCHPHKLEVRRTNPWFAGRSFTIFPLADT